MLRANKLVAVFYRYYENENVRYFVDQKSAEQNNLSSGPTIPIIIY